MPPTRWEASQRPLFVRTVWVGGTRHAILSQDDPASRRCNNNNNSSRRPKRRACSAPVLKPCNRPGRAVQTHSAIEACLSNKSLEAPGEESPRPNQFTDRVYQWLEAAGKVRPPTPFEGALWESPRGDILNLSAGPLRIATKNVELNVICTPVGRQHFNAGPETRPSSPGLKQTFTSAAQLTSRSYSGRKRPQLHIFMPLVQEVHHRPSIDARV